MQNITPILSQKKERETGELRSIYELGLNPSGDRFKSSAIASSFNTITAQSPLKPPLAGIRISLDEHGKRYSENINYTDADQTETREV